MNRRNLLQAAPAALVASAVPVAASVAGYHETPVMRKYGIWKKAMDDWSAALAVDNSDDNSNAWCAHAYALVADAIDTPSQGPLDFIYKLMMHTCEGEFEISDADEGQKIWDEARGYIAA